MKFVKVKAQKKGEPRAGVISDFEFLLNVDLIGVFDQDTILLNGGDTLLLNGREYTRFRLVDKNDIQKL